MTHYNINYITYIYIYTYKGYYIFIGGPPGRWTVRLQAGDAALFVRGDEQK